MTSVSSGSSYASNPSTNLSNIAGGTPSTNNNKREYKSAGPTGGNTSTNNTATTTARSPSPNTNGVTIHNKGESSTIPDSLSKVDSGEGSTKTTPVFHNDSSTNSTGPTSHSTIINNNLSSPGAPSPSPNSAAAAAKIPSTPLILTPELNETLTNAYVPAHGDDSWMKDLVSKMQAARIEIDKKAHLEQQHINEDATRRVNALLQEHKHQQDALIASSHKRLNEIDTDYNRKREEAVAALEAQKMKLKNALEADLLSQQQKLASEVRSKVATIAEEAKQQKLKVTEDAQKREREISNQVITSVGVPQQ